MKCDIAKLLLREFFDEDINELLAEKVGKHLEKCQNCRNELQTDVKLRKFAEDLRELPAPPDFFDLKEKIDLEINKYESTENKEYFSLAEIIEKFKLKSQGISKLCAELTVFEFGDNLYFKKSDVETWITNVKTDSSPETRKNSKTA